MTRSLVSALIALPMLVASASAVHAQNYNPYRQQYNQWNQQFPGYQGGGKEYRQQIREMNPYGDVYGQFQQENRRNRSWGGW